VQQCIELSRTNGRGLNVVVRRTRSFSGVRKNSVDKINNIRNKKSLGDKSGGGTPGNIPNPAVKPACADGTWGATPWESRSLPRGFLCIIIDRALHLNN
jgi:hypothetical protein